MRGSRNLAARSIIDSKLLGASGPTASILFDFYLLHFLGL